MEYSIRLNRSFSVQVLFLITLIFLGTFGKVLGSNIFITHKAYSKKKRRELQNLDKLTLDIKELANKNGSSLIYKSNNSNETQGIAIIISDWHKLDKSDEFGTSIHEINSRTLIDIIEKIKPDYTLMEGSSNSPKILFQQNTKNLDELINKIPVSSAVAEVYLSNKGHKFIPAEKHSEVLEQLLYFLIQDSDKASSRALNYSLMGVGSLLFNFEEKAINKSHLRLWQKMINELAQDYNLTNKNYFQIKQADINVAGTQIQFPYPNINYELIQRSDIAELKAMMKQNYSQLLKTIEKRDQSIVNNFRIGKTIPMIVGQNHVLDLVKKLEQRKITTIVLSAHHANELKLSLASINS